MIFAPTIRRLPRFHSIIFALAVTIIVPARGSYGDDSFDVLRNSVRAAETPSPPQRLPQPDDDRKKSRPFSFTNCDRDEPEEHSFTNAFLTLLTLPITIPQMIVNDNTNEYGYFPRFPYDDDIPGGMLIGSSEYQPQRWQTLRARSEYAANFGGGERIGMQFLYDMTCRIGIDSDNNYRTQYRWNGTRDSVWTGDTNVVVRFAQSEKWQLRTGLGVNWFSDNVGSNGGFNFTYGGDWFPVKPWVVSSEIDAGTLGHADLFHFRTTVGVVLQRTEIYAGYDYYTVGRFESQGIMVGLRLWF